MSAKKYEALKNKVYKLLENGFIHEAQYLVWVYNPVLVPKSNEKWQTCQDFIGLNKASPNDSFPFHKINQLVDTTVRHELLRFMDAYSEYNKSQCME